MNTTNTINWDRCSICDGFFRNVAIHQGRDIECRTIRDANREVEN